jgi:hypothetical protein
MLVTKMSCPGELFRQLPHERPRGVEGAVLMMLRTARTAVRDLLKGFQKGASAL